MTAIASLPRAASDARPTPPYRHAHWYMLGAFGVVLLGFWPTFYRPMSSATTLIHVHGITATLWYLALIVQPWLVTHGYVAWHRRVALVVIGLLPLVSVSALMTTQVMLTRSTLPPFARPLIAWLDITLTTLFVALFVLGLTRRGDRGAHRRYMVSTALLGFPPAITRWVLRTFPELGFLPAIHVSFALLELVLLVLIWTDWRSGERRRIAYPLALGVHVMVQLTMVPVSGSGWWLAFCRWYGGA